MRPIQRLVTLAAIGLVLVTGCVSTKMVHTWARPGFDKTAVKKVLVRIPGVRPLNNRFGWFVAPS